MVQKSGDHHAICMKPVVNNGIFTISTGWPDSFYQQYQQRIKQQKWIHLRPPQDHDKVLPDLPRRPGVHGWAKILT